MLEELLEHAIASAVNAAAAGPSSSKTVLLVRHGQSTHNATTGDLGYGDMGDDDALYDAPLSTLGQEQAKRLAGQYDDVDLAIVSPLTRAVQTMLGARPRVPVEVWAIAAEHLTESCDIGTGASTLARRFPSVSFEGLPEVWWYTDEDDGDDAMACRARFRECTFIEPETRLEERIDVFAARLRARSEQRIAVFGHSDYFYYLLDRHCPEVPEDDRWLENGKCLEVRLPPSGSAWASEAELCAFVKWRAAEEVLSPSSVPPTASGSDDADAELSEAQLAAIERALAAFLNDISADLDALTGWPPQQLRKWLAARLERSAAHDARRARCADQLIEGDLALDAPSALDRMLLDESEVMLSAVVHWTRLRQARALRTWSAACREQRIISTVRPLLAGWRARATIGNRVLRRCKGDLLRWLESARESRADGADAEAGLTRRVRQAAARAVMREEHGEGGGADGADGGGGTNEPKAASTVILRALDESIAAGPLAATELDVGQLTLGMSIAEGEFAEVFRGRLWGQKVAVKQLKTMRDGATAASVQAELRHEATILAGLSHPSVLTLIGYTPAPAQLVLEVLHGTVYDLVRAGTAHCDGGLLGPLIDILSGCAYLHARSPPLLHRDLKPPNVLYDEARGACKICDFGTALELPADPAHHPFECIGSALYLAPEVEAEAPYGLPADVFSFAVLAYELYYLDEHAVTFYGEEDMFEGGGLMAGLELIRTPLLAAPQEHPPRPTACADAVWQLLTSCWLTEPSARPPFAKVAREMGIARQQLKGGDGRDEWLGVGSH